MLYVSFVILTLAFQSFDFERTWCRLFQTRVVCTELDIEIFIEIEYDVMWQSVLIVEETRVAGESHHIRSTGMGENLQTSVMIDTAYIDVDQKPPYDDDNLTKI